MTSDTAPTPLEAAPSAHVNPDAFRDVVGRFATGVTVVTTHHEGRDHGMTASAVCSLSLDPPMVLVCVNRRAPTHDAVSASGVFAINILDEAQAALAHQFAVARPDKFAGADVTRGDSGSLLLDGALAHLECEVAEEVDGGTHTVFFGRVRRAEAGAGAPLAYFRGQFGQLQLSAA